MQNSKSCQFEEHHPVFYLDDNSSGSFESDSECICGETFLANPRIQELVDQVGI